MIEVQHLTKRYGKIVAVDDLSFSIEPGQILGLLGPNGAGKSTTMNILTGYLSSTEGRVLIDGIDILEHPIEAKRKIGYLPEIPLTEVTGYFGTKTEEAVRAFQELYGIPVTGRVGALTWNTITFVYRRLLSEQNNTGES